VALRYGASVGLLLNAVLLFAAAHQDLGEAQASAGDLLALSACLAET
jgi:hypothetical protein